MNDLREQVARALNRAMGFDPAGWADELPLADAAIAAGVGAGWKPIETAPRDGTMVLLWRPLAGKSNDPVLTMRRTTPTSRFVWPTTIPEGCDGQNFTEGSCYATHWHPLPDAPTPPASPETGEAET